VINISVKEEDISTSHPLQSYNSDAPPKIILKFTRKDVRNVFYANRTKLTKISTNALPDLGVTDQENICISESLTPFKRTLFGEVNSLKWQDLRGRGRKNRACLYWPNIDLEGFKCKYGC